MEKYLFICLFLLLFITSYVGISWLLETGIYRIKDTSRAFVVKEEAAIRSKSIPNIHSDAFWDKLELFLIYCGVRRVVPFMSGRVFVLLVILCMIIAFNISFLFHIPMFLTIVIVLTVIALMYVVLTFVRQGNMRRTEGGLLELINLAESFCVTEDEIIAVLGHCARYTKTPIAKLLKDARTKSDQGVSTRIVLEELKVGLEHPRWQEFIHNLNICSIYNSDFQYVFHASRKNMQSYLTSKKERESVKRAAKVEMLILSLMGVVIMYMMGSLLEISIQWLLLETMFGKILTVYFIVISIIFTWKIIGFEKV